MKTLSSCQAYGVATPFGKKWGNSLFKCADTSPCNARRDFGGAKCCAESPILLVDKEKKPEPKPVETKPVRWGFDV
jgi:hypothetical protein